MTAAAGGAASENRSMNAFRPRPLIPTGLAGLAFALADRLLTSAPARRLGLEHLWLLYRIGRLERAYGIVRPGRGCGWLTIARKERP
mgnify:CR=1 FL=1